MKTLIGREHVVACEIDMTTHNAYHVEFRVCLVSNPLVRVVFSNFCKLREKFIHVQIAQISV